MQEELKNIMLSWLPRGHVAVTPLPEGDYKIIRVECTELSSWFFVVEGKRMAQQLDAYIFKPIFPKKKSG